jgi:ankyrin repeat protein
MNSTCVSPVSVFSNFGSSSPMLLDCDAVDERGNTLLHTMVERSLEDKVKNLVYRGFDVNKQNFEGQTPLYLATLQNHLKIVQFLLRAGANPNLGNIDGATPVHVAAANGFSEVLAVLVRHGAFVNYQDQDGDAPLHYAVREGHVKIIEELVKNYKADVNIRNEDLETPQQLALCLNEPAMVQLLSKRI